MPADKRTVTINVSKLTKDTLMWLIDYSEYINLNAGTDIPNPISPEECIPQDKSKDSVIKKRKLTRFLNALVEALVTSSIAEFNYSLTTFQKDEWLNILLSKFELDKHFYDEARKHGDVDNTTVKRDFILDIIDELLLEYIESVGSMFINYPNRIITIKVVNNVAIITLGEDYRIAAYKKSHPCQRWSGEEWES